MICLKCAKEAMKTRAQNRRDHSEEGKRRRLIDYSVFKNVKI